MARKRNLPKDQSVVSIRLPKPLHKGLQEAALSNDRSVAQEVRRLITQHVERETEKAA